MKRIYTCGICDGSVSKEACPTKNAKGLGRWKCVARGCVRAATSRNKAGAFKQVYDARQMPTGDLVSPIRTGQSPRTVVKVRLVA